MTSLDKQIEALIKESEALKAQASELRESLVMMFNGGWDEAHTNNIAAQAKAVLNRCPEQCAESIRLSAIRDLARTECPVSGYIITSPSSRMQMLEWANFSEKHSNE